MTVVVVDANFSLAQVLPLPYALAVIRRMGVWQNELPHILVPVLCEYEVVIGLWRASHQKLLSLDELLGMELEVVPASPSCTGAPWNGLNAWGNRGHTTHNTWRWRSRQPLSFGREIGG
jgi:ABC-type sulfate transport system substrate-binding protein